MVLKYSRSDMKSFYAFVFSIVFSIVFSLASWAENLIFLVKEEDTVLIQQGDITQRYNPSLTMDVFLALNASAAGLIKNPDEPIHNFKYDGFPPLGCSGKDTPKLWMQNNCYAYGNFLGDRLIEKACKNYKKYKYPLQYYFHAAGYGDWEVIQKRIRNYWPPMNFLKFQFKNRWRSYKRTFLRSGHPAVQKKPQR